MENLNVALVCKYVPPFYASTIKWKSVLEGRSYISTVTYKDIDTVTQEELNAYDLVVGVSECGADADQSKLRGLTVPVLCMNVNAKGILQFGVGYSLFYNKSDIKITDNTHPITEIYALNEILTVQDAWWMYGVGGYPLDMDQLAEANYPGVNPVILATMDVGGEFLDAFVNTSKFAFWNSCYYIDATHDITADGLTLLDRIISWLMGEYDAKTLSIQSAGAANVAIQVSPLDKDGAGDGNTNFTRRYDSGTEVTLIALERVGDNYFQKWTIDGIDSFDLSKIITISNEDKTITVTYIPLIEITVQSSGADNVAIGVSVTDEDGNKDGTTEFIRKYKSGVDLVLTAPSGAGDLVFSKWTYDGSDYLDLGLEITTVDAQVALVLYIPLDYVDVIKFDVPPRAKDFTVPGRAKSFNVPKRAKSFNVKRI